MPSTYKTEIREQRLGAPSFFNPVETFAARQRAGRRSKKVKTVLSSLFLNPRAMSHESRADFIPTRKFFAALSSKKAPR
ncbi:MAG: hypothetical protein J5958_03215, partial [Clostridia bacterium]|nr:hypothetical protein [Clostridia bacterium]